MTESLAIPAGTDSAASSWGKAWQTIFERLSEDEVARHFHGKSVTGKPIHFAMDDLINREWKTSLVAKSSGGKVAFRGFRGRYRLTWKDADGMERSKFVEVN